MDKELFIDALKYVYAKKREQCKKHYYSFFKEMWHTVCKEDYVHNWSTEFICDELQIAGTRVINRQPKLYDLVFNLPPGETKSINISQLWNAWLWINDPTIRFLGSSVNFTLSEMNAMRTKDCITSERFIQIFGEMKLKDDLQGKGHFMNDKGGERNTTSVNGEPVGFHYHILAADDWMGAKEILTSTKINQVKQHFGKIITRKVDLRVTLFVLLAQRMGVNDPTDIVLSKLKKVRHIILPAEDRYPIQPPELRKYYVNGLLNPHRKPLEVLLEEKEQLETAAAYDAQFGQHPTNAEGKMIKKEDFVYKDITELPQGFFAVKKYMTADTAYTTNKNNDPSGLLIYVYYQNLLYLLDFYEFWDETPELSKKIKKIMTDGSIDLIHVENKASGGPVASTLRTTYGINARDFKIETITSTNKKGTGRALSKEARLNRHIGMIEGRRVVIVWTRDNKTRMEKFVHYATQFPDKAIHDEAIDCLTMAMKIVSTKKSNRKWR